MAGRLYIIDLDRTIFDTARFFNDVLAALQRTHHLDLEQSRATMNDFIDPDAGGYDPHSHHEKLLGLSADELDSVITRELSQHDYVFPDAAKWLEEKRAEAGNEFVILTIGRPRYQKLKVAHAQAAQGLPLVVIPRDKAREIRERYLGRSYSQITFIDDAAEVFTEIPDQTNLTLVRIARPGEKYSDVPCAESVRQITNFGELQ